VSPRVRSEERGTALVINLARPPLNILDLDTIADLDQTLAPLTTQSDVKILILHSTIPNVFSAGVNVADHARDRVKRMLESFHAIFRRLDALPQATIAAVDGLCLGNGCELAAFCDLVLATPGSSFGQP